MRWFFPQNISVMLDTKFSTVNQYTPSYARKSSKPETFTKHKTVPSLSSFLQAKRFDNFLLYPTSWWNNFFLTAQTGSSRNFQKTTETYRHTRSSLLLIIQWGHENVSTFLLIRSNDSHQTDKQRHLWPNLTFLSINRRFPKKKILNSVAVFFSFFGTCESQTHFVLQIN